MALKGIASDKIEVIGLDMTKSKVEVKSIRPKVPDASIGAKNTDRFQETN